MNMKITETRTVKRTIPESEVERVRIRRQDHAVAAAIAKKYKISIGIVISDALATHLAHNPELAAIATQPQPQAPEAA